MAFHTAVNTQITDAVTQTNVQVLGEAPALSSGESFIAGSQAFANAAHNATANALQANIAALAAGAKGAASILGIDTSSNASAPRPFHPLRNPYPR